MAKAVLSAKDLEIIFSRKSTMLDQTAKDKITKLIEVLEKPETAFSIETDLWYEYTENPVDSIKGECGSPACIAGWWLHLFNEFLHDLLDSKTHAYLCAPQIYHPTTNGNSYGVNPDWFTKARSIACLKHLRDTGYVVDWQIIDRNA